MFVDSIGGFIILPEVPRSSQPTKNDSNIQALAPKSDKQKYEETQKKIQALPKIVELTNFANSSFGVASPQQRN